MAEGVYSYDGDDRPPPQNSVRLPEPLKQVFVPIMHGGVDVWTLVFEQFDLASYVKAQVVCRKWRSTCLFSSIGMRILEREVDRAMALLDSVTKRSKSLPGFHVDTPCDEQISEFVKETASDAKLYLRRVMAQSSELSSNSHFLMLFDLFQFHLKNAEGYLSSATEMSEEADVVEIALKRALLQLEKIFPLQGPANHLSDPKRLNLIRDKHARSIWDGLMRNRQAPWVRIRDAERALRLDTSPSLSSQLRSILDFPRDSIITVFRRKNFFGFINRSHAERLLMQHPPKSVLLRSSRTHPSLIAISYRAVEGPVMHITNNRNFWTMPDFAEPLRKISQAKGKISHNAPVPIDYFVDLFEQSGYMILSSSLPEPEAPSDSAPGLSPVVGSSGPMMISSMSLATSSYVNDDSHSSPSSASYWRAESSGSMPTTQSKISFGYADEAVGSPQAPSKTAGQATVSYSGGYE